MKNIVLNIPHSSVNGIFDESIGNWPRNPFFINDCVNQWTDWWTDMLFTVSEVENVSKVVFPYSRFVCDAERLCEDVLERLGHGIIYTEFEGYKRGKLSAESKEFLKRLWQKHQDNLKSHLNENSVIVDCHSFPSIKSNTDICIGFNDDWSYDERLVNDVRKIFKDYGYSVEFNAPYSNSITPYTGFKYKSLMIEVNKKVYMNEKLMILNRNPRQWMRWYGCLKKVYERILEKS